MTDDLNKNISDKEGAIRSDAFLAKKSFDAQKDAFDQYTPDDFTDDYVNDVENLRHELKLMMSIMNESKFLFNFLTSSLCVKMDL